MTVSRHSRRSGATAVETAIVFPIVLFLLLALIVGGIGVFCYQQTALMSQEACRWASVRGADYHKDSNQPCPTQSQILSQAVLPYADAMDTSQLAIHAQWIDQGTGVAQDWDGAPKTVRSLNAQGTYVTNTVRVTVTYNWSPGIFFGTIALKAQCEMPMSE